MNYGDLKQYVTDLTKRPDLSDQMDNFFNLAHSVILIEVDWQSMEEYIEISGDTAINVAGNVWGFDMPVDSLRIRSLTSNGIDIEYMLPAQLREFYRNGGAAQSRNWSVVGRKIWTAPGANDIALIYQRAEPMMIADDDENEIARLFPNIYIWGATAQLNAYVQDVEEEQKAVDRMGVSMADANKLAKASRYGVAAQMRG